MSETALDPRRPGLAGRIAAAIPTLALLAITVLVGVWGHRNHWTLPKFSTLFAPPAEADDWCDDHSVPKSIKDYGKEEAPKVNHVRKVRTGARTDRLTEIIVGVLPGETVATEGSAMLRAELLRDKLGETE